MAERRWQPKATPVPEKYTVTVAGTWAAADTATVTINEKDLTLTVGSLVTTAQVATSIKEMINGDSFTDPTATATITGDKIGEFSNLTATVSGSVVTVTGGRLDTDGTQTHLRSRPFTLTATESTAGTGTATAAQVTAATGPHHVNNADNWSGGAVPVDSDDVVYDDGTVDCLYALSALTAVSLASFVRRGSYTGKIGLATLNQDNPALPFYEYLTQYLTLGDSGDAVTTTFTLESDGGRTFIDNGDGQAVFNVRSKGSGRENPNVPSILLKGTHASNTLDLQAGDVGVAFYDGEAAALATIRVSYLTDRVGDAKLVCGDGVTLTTIVQTGGEVVIDSNVVTVTVETGQIQIGDRAAPTVTTLNLDGGTGLYRGGGTLTTLNVGAGGVIDFRAGTKPVTVTTANLYAGSSYYDIQGRVTHTNGIDLVRCRVSDLTAFEHVRHITATFSAI
jgi:hypothetical protein